MPVPSRLDVMTSKEEQIKILVPYLEKVASQKEGEEDLLPITVGSRVLIDRYMRGWRGLFDKQNLTAMGAFLYYKKLVEEVK